MLWFGLGFGLLYGILFGFAVSSLPSTLEFWNMVGTWISALSTSAAVWSTFYFFQKSQNQFKPKLSFDLSLNDKSGPLCFRLEITSQSAASARVKTVFTRVADTSIDDIPPALAPKTFPVDLIAYHDTSIFIEAVQNTVLYCSCLGCTPADISVYIVSSAGHKSLTLPTTDHPAILKLISEYQELNYTPDTYKAYKALGRNIIKEFKGKRVPSL